MHRIFGIQAEYSCAWSLAGLWPGNHNSCAWGYLIGLERLNGIGRYALAGEIAAVTPVVGPGEDDWKYIRVSGVGLEVNSELSRR